MSESIKLVSQSGKTSTFVSLEITDDGDLRFSGQDLGELPSKLFNDSDYEYWLTIPSSEKDNLLLALIKDKYAGDISVIANMMKFLEERGINSEFFSYT